MTSAYTLPELPYDYSALAPHISGTVSYTHLTLPTSDLV